ncbi:RNA-binding S4 domain-containing protein [Filimonas effusa]|uniref:RNA-binding S4 domain-containing protein n=1 Tax=Filimonas effusa TaxID=2508721 RepID=A0A4Q1D1M8_9BACT|nr:RNA-binding S4 domain-containing protein [Filimonas effusa]RXK81721.1 RNA-binding S4 domain-containing protein [Filimonas effusa]
MEKEKLRIDKYLWSIRVFKTRSQAADACSRGRVKVQGTPVKASRVVSIGDEYEIRAEARKWVVKVTGLLDHRVQYSEAVNFYTDLTPPEDLDAVKSQAAAFNTGKRQSKIGRPTKRERRDLDGFMDIDAPDGAEQE